MATAGTLLGGKYQLVEIAGEGGMATVWRAQMRGAAGFSRPVALKRIHPSLLGDQQFIAMFVEEARVGSQLHHPNIVQIIDFCVDDRGAYFLVMDWVEGLDLAHYTRAFRQREQVTPWPLIAAVGIEALRGLSAAHERIDERGERSPVIHRDVTPQNILIGTNGITKLTDFGLSRAMDRARMTHPDIVKGKLAYLAPEICHGHDATARSDLFSLGVVLWEAFAGRRLYQGETDVDVFLAVREADVPPLLDIRDDLPSTVASVLDRALHDEPAQRYDDAREMARDLASILREVRQPTDAPVISRSVIEAKATLARPGEGNGERMAQETPAATPSRARPAPPPPPKAAIDGTGPSEVVVPLTKRKSPKPT